MRKLMKGNEAIVRSAMLAGCRAFYGYPITPASEITESAALYLPQVGGVFLQAESEVASINMLYGAAAAGVRCMTSSSGPGISLMQEGISYLAGAELPCVIADITRGGPGLGNIAPEQSDYHQVVKGGGHGNYRTIVLAPDSVQEMADLTALAFELADRYRNPVVLMADGYIGQMMEPVEFPAGAVAAADAVVGGDGNAGDAAQPDHFAAPRSGRTGSAQSHAGSQVSRSGKDRGAGGGRIARGRGDRAGGLRHRGANSEGGHRAGARRRYARWDCCGPSRCIRFP